MQHTARMPVLHGDGRPHHATLHRNHGALGATCFILADDVLIIVKGPLMLTILARAINFTHRRLQTMGAKITPDKSCIFASTPLAEKRLRKTRRNETANTIEVIKDFRYLGTPQHEGRCQKPHG